MEESIVPISEDIKRKRKIYGFEDELLVLREKGYTYKEIVDYLKKQGVVFLCYDNMSIERKFKYWRRCNKNVIKM